MPVTHSLPSPQSLHGKIEYDAYYYEVGDWYPYQFVDDTQQED